MDFTTTEDLSRTKDLAAAVRSACGGTFCPVIVEVAKTGSGPVARMHSRFAGSAKVTTVAEGLAFLAAHKAAKAAGTVPREARVAGSAAPAYLGGRTVPAIPAKFRHLLPKAR